MPVCKECHLGFEISEKEREFCRRFLVPAPEVCRPCRLRELMAFRNEWTLYKRKCDLTGEDIISAYSPDSPFTVYKNDVWWGNDWDAMDYGRDYDFSRPFFEQYAELQKVIPREGTSVFSSENSDYNCHIRESKNCYLNSLVYQCEDTHYSYWMVHDKDVMDSMYTNESEKCYSCTSVNGGYDCVQLEESTNSKECYFSYQLRGCDHCIYCTNLVNKSYYMFNKPCTQAEFEEMKGKLLNGTYSRWKQSYDHYLEVRKKAKHRALHNLNCENVTGDHLYNCRNLEDCFESFDSEEGVNAVSLDRSKMVHNIYSAGWPGCEGVYFSSVIRGSKDIAFSTYIWSSGSMRYCDSCSGCDSCFGCIGLQHKKYCILNKQYSKEEYESLMPKIVEHMKSASAIAGQAGGWGKFFPHHLSPYAYNESAAQDFFPLDKKEIVGGGWRWRERDEKEYQPATIAEIPDSIHDVADSIINEILACEDCGRNYKIVKQELRFYRKMNLPIPRKCPGCRHKSRFQLRNPLKLFDRTCGACGKNIRSSYAPGRTENVLCDECYLKAVS